MTKWIVALAILLLSPLTMANQPDFPHLQVTGFGEVSMPPDSATFSVEVQKSAVTASAAKDAADKAVYAFLLRLNNENVNRDDIQSANIRLSPEYQYGEGRERKQTGFRASRTVTVIVRDLAQLNPLLNASLGDGIDAINNINMTVSHEAEYQRQARQLAIADARQKAKEIAAGFDMKVDSVWQIQYQSHRPMPMMRGVLLADSIESNSYQDSKISTQDTISVIFTLKDK